MITCSICRRECGSWWEVIHGHVCKTLDAYPYAIGDDDDRDGDLSTDEAGYDGEQEAAYNDWKDGRED